MSRSSEPHAAGPPGVLSPSASSFIATLSGLGLAASGLMVAVAGAQLWALVTFFSWWLIPVPYVLLLTGVCAMGLGGLTTRSRFWAAIAGTGLAVFMALAMCAWTIYSVIGGMISGVAILATLFTLVSALLMPFSVVPVYYMDRDRRALYA